MEQVRDISDAAGVVHTFFTPDEAQRWRALPVTKLDAILSFIHIAREQTPKRAVRGDIAASVALRPEALRSRPLVDRERPRQSIHRGGADVERNAPDVDIVRSEAAGLLETANWNEWIP